MNYHAFTATRSNSFKVSTWTNKDVGDEYLHSVHGRGIVVHRIADGAGIMGHLLIVRTDITLDQLIERL